MTDAGLRDLGGSRHSLREAIGRLDGATPAPAPAGRASTSEEPPTSVWFRRPWLILSIVGVAAAAAVASLFAS